MEFSALPDFTLLKNMVLRAAKAQNIDIFDNVFDWTLQLTRTPVSSDPSRNNRSGSCNEKLSSKKLEKIANF